MRTLGFQLATLDSPKSSLQVENAAFYVMCWKKGPKKHDYYKQNKQDASVARNSLECLENVPQLGLKCMLFDEDHCKETKRNTWLST